MTKTLGSRMKANFGSKERRSGMTNALTTRLSERNKDQPLRSVQDTDNGESETAPTSHALFIIPTRRGDGFRASIHGHMLELADPTDYRLAPSPDDLLIASIASELAWSARRFLRACGMPDDVSVSAEWRRHKDAQRLDDLNLTVSVTSCADAVSTALAAAFENSLAARSLAKPVVHISLDGVNR
jgi:uncharacterized OsmC-like protein